MLKIQQKGEFMNLFFNALKECILFKNIDNKNLNSILHCLNVRRKIFTKGQIVFAEGDPATHLGIVISGCVQIVREDYYGNRSVMAKLGESEVFGEVFAYANIKAMPVNVIACENTEVILIDSKKLTSTCANACSFHNNMIYNLLEIIAAKNLAFNRKLEVICKRTTREKLMTYLLLQAKEMGSNTFTIPYNRQELADYLDVDRSGLSSEISKLRNEKIILCNKSTFTIL